MAHTQRDRETNASHNKRNNPNRNGIWKNYFEKLYENPECQKLTETQTKLVEKKYF